uniref:Uncharacterized protein n=1 Tax=Oryza sativa subsp. japonica TaxID=39947 RepID=Q69UK7_ORYSJ|nr:hypothetical protein [Oryza sativa Japonica Group]
MAPRGVAAAHGGEEVGGGRVWFGDQKEIKNQVVIQKEKRKIGAKAIEQYLGAAAAALPARRSDCGGSSGVRRRQRYTRGGATVGAMVECSGGNGAREEARRLFRGPV